MQNNNHSLYRKYRPTKFNDVAGHKNTVEILTRQLSDDKIGHAFLFAGQRGTGKTSVARILAKSVNCKKLSRGVSCETCESCIASNEGRSPDIFEIDAASNNGVEEIRNIKANVSTLPIYGKYKVYIIDEVHMLTKAAFNALLKTLEEPPAHALFILATTEFHKIPPTILSRCQIFNFNKIRKEDLINRLYYVSKQENREVEKEVLTEIFYLSDGSLRDALNVLEQLLVATDEKISIGHLKENFYVATKQEKINLIKNILENRPEQIIAYFELSNNQGMDFDIFTLSIIEIVKEIISYNLTKQEQFLGILDKEEADKFSSIPLQKMFDIADNLSEAYKTGNKSNISYNYLLISILKSFDKKENVVEEIKIKQEPANIKEENFQQEVEIVVEKESIKKEEVKKEPEVVIEEEIIEEPIVEEKSDLIIFKKEQDLKKSFNQKIISNQDIQIKEIEIEEIINALTGRIKTKTEEFDQIKDKWFEVTTEGEFVNPQKASQFELLFNSHVIVASKNELLIVVRLVQQARLLIRALENEEFRRAINKEFNQELIILPIDSETWKQTREMFIVKKQDNELPNHEIRDVNEYYNNLKQNTIVKNNSFVKKATELFDEDDLEIEE